MSLANSAGIALGTEWHFNLVRPGAALYGLEAAAFAKLAPLKRAVHLRARVVQIQEVSKGSTVWLQRNLVRQSANPPCHHSHWLRRWLGCALAPSPQKNRWHNRRNSAQAARHGLLTLYGTDNSRYGASRFLSLCGGRISMDLVSVEATAAPFLKVGDWLDLFPPEASDTGSRDLSALPYEAAFPYARDALCALGTRVQRVFV